MAESKLEKKPDWWKVMRTSHGADLAPCIVGIIGGLWSLCLQYGSAHDAIWYAEEYLALALVVFAALFLWRRMRFDKYALIVWSADNRMALEDIVSAHRLFAHDSAHSGASKWADMLAGETRYLLVPLHARLPTKITDPKRYPPQIVWPARFPQQPYHEIRWFLEDWSMRLTSNLIPHAPKFVLEGPDATRFSVELFHLGGLLEALTAKTAAIGLPWEKISHNGLGVLASDGLEMLKTSAARSEELREDRKALGATAENLEEQLRAMRTDLREARSDRASFLATCAMVFGEMTKGTRYPRSKEAQLIRGALVERLRVLLGDSPELPEPLRQAIRDRQKARDRELKAPVAVPAP